MAGARVGEEQRILLVGGPSRVEDAVEPDEDAVIEPGREMGRRQREPRCPFALGAGCGAGGVGQRLEGDQRLDTDAGIDDRHRVARLIDRS